jgi:hypothetical protein
MVGVGSQQAQVVVRRVPGVVGIEAVDQGQYVVGMRADELSQQGLDPRFVVLAEFRFERWEGSAKYRPK